MENKMSQLHGSMVVHSPVEDLLNLLVSLEARRKWDLFFEGGRVLEKISDSEFTILIMMASESGKLCYTMKCDVKHYSPSSVSFALETVMIPNAILPPGYSYGGETRALYKIEVLGTSDSLFQAALAAADNEPGDSIEAEAVADVPYCQLTYEMEQTNDTFAFTAAALEGRQILLSWSRLKALVENQDLVGSKGSITHDTLQDMVQRKHLTSHRMAESFGTNMSD
jgi:hypothetical protein